MQGSIQCSLPSEVSLLAAPTPSFVDDTLPSYLAAAMINTLRDSTRHAVKKQLRLEEELVAEGMMQRPNGGTANGSAQQQEDERVDVGLKQRLHAIGCCVGGHIAERLIAQRPSLATPLDVVKFVCKDFFLYTYARQIDNLRTNHRGVYVLQSNAFPPLVPISSYRGSGSDLHASQIYLVLPAAMMQGCLERLDLPSQVTAESGGLPQCTFSIKTKQSDGTVAPVPPATATPLPPRAD